MVKTLSMIALIFSATFGLSIGSAAFGAGADRGSCMKDGKAVTVKGETAEEKKQACEEVEKGKWTEGKEKPKKASSGGGW
jgi:hypothetical protein